MITAAGDAHSTGMQSYLRMMAVRLLEMRRVLAPHGSIYLHCDDTAGAYLRMLMDAVFGCGTFRNEIVWKRSERSDGRRFGRTHDTILAYARSHEATWNNVRVPYSKDYIDRFYREKDNRGPPAPATRPPAQFPATGWNAVPHIPPRPWQDNFQQPGMAPGRAGNACSDHRAPRRRPLMGEGCRQAQRHRAPHSYRRPLDTARRPPGAPGARA